MLHSNIGHALEFCKPVLVDVALLFLSNNISDSSITAVVQLVHVPVQSSVHTVHA